MTAALVFRFTDAFHNANKDITHIQASALVQDVYMQMCRID